MEYCPFSEPSHIYLQVKALPKTPLLPMMPRMLLLTLLGTLPETLPLTLPEADALSVAMVALLTQISVEEPEGVALPEITQKIRQMAPSKLMIKNSFQLSAEIEMNQIIRICLRIIGRKRKISILFYANAPPRPPARPPTHTHTPRPRWTRPSLKQRRRRRPKMPSRSSK